MLTHVHKSKFFHSREIILNSTINQRICKGKDIDIQCILQYITADRSAHIWCEILTIILHESLFWNKRVMGEQSSGLIGKKLNCLVKASCCNPLLIYIYIYLLAEVW